MSAVRLSICIPTMNRGHLIGETLDSIVPQLTAATEIVIVDGGSKDDTKAVVAGYVQDHPHIRFIESVANDAPSNEGFDRDCDLAVREARGDYCWLFTDDDLIVPGAVAKVLDQLVDDSLDLLLVDSEVRNLSMTKVLDRRRFAFAGVRDYGPNDRDRFMADAGRSLSFVGGVIIRRAAWLERQRAPYFGSGFIHVGVVFQAPPLARSRILGEPLVQIRIGNAAWSGRAFDIWMEHWPRLIWGFAGYSDEAKAAVTAREPWRALLELLNYRALDALQARHLAWLADAGAPRRHRLVARLLLAVPGPVAHVAMSARVAVGRMRRSSHAYTLLVSSGFANPLSRTIARLNGHCVERNRDG